MKQNRFGILLQAGLIAILISLVIPAHSSYAQTNTLQIEVTPAFDGYFKYGEWLPVWVEITNQGNDLEAEIQIRIVNPQGTIFFKAPVQLPSGSHKRVPVYILPNNFSRELKVELVEGGKIIAAQPLFVRPQANISYFIGLIVPERQALSLIDGVNFPGQERPKISVDLSLDALPERGEALNSFDLIIINNTDTSKLTTGQASALYDWVSKGGRLVLGGGSGAQKTLLGIPDPLKPADIAAVSEISGSEAAPIASFAKASDIQSPGPFTVAVSQPVPGAQILAGQKDLPVIVQKEVGGGFVNFVAFDLSGVPFNGWPGVTKFWEMLIGPSGSYPQNMPFDVSPRTYRANSLSYALSNLPSLDLPSIQWILVVLVIYILVIGPVNYFFLKKKQRLHLAWITIPALTTIFTAGSFGIGYTMRGNDLILNKIALVQPGISGDANVTSYMGLFSPRQQSYEVVVNDPGLISPMGGYEANPWDSSNLNATGGEMEFIQGNPAIVKGLTVNQWSMQSFMSEGTWSGFGQFSSDLSLENDTLHGPVRNETGYRLSDAVVIFQGRFTRLGDFEPGETKMVDIGLTNTQSDRFGPPLSYRLFQENNPSGGLLPRAAEVKTNIVSAIFENSPWGTTNSSTPFSFGFAPIHGVYLIGWLNQAPPEIEIKGSNLSYQTTTLVYTGLSVHYPASGFISFPAGMIPGTVTKYPQSGGGTCGFSNSVSMARGEAEFEFWILNFSENIQVQTLKLAFSWDNSFVEMPEISLYQWKKELWTPIQDPIQGTNIIQHGSDFIDQNGLVRVRLMNNNDTYTCIYLDMGMEADVAQENQE